MGTENPTGTDVACRLLLLVSQLVIDHVAALYLR